MLLHQWFELNIKYNTDDQMFINFQIFILNFNVAHYHELK